MGRYILRRILQAVPLLIGISLISFFLMHLAPGDPTDIYILSPNVSPSDIARLRGGLGLDDPLPIQYLKWAKSMFTGGMGISYRYGRPVTEVIGERLPATLTLMLSSLFLSVLFAFPAGIFSALRRNTLADGVVTVGAFVGIALPSFWMGMMLQYLFSVKLGWLPSSGMRTIGSGFDIFDRIRHLIMPSFVLGLVYMAGWSRYIRSGMIETLEKDYIRTARGKGLPEELVIGRHAMKNALIPIITVMGMSLPEIFGGAAVTETVFAWPGIGSLYVNSIMNRDYPVAMGILMIMAVLVVLGNLAADILYACLDPRIRYDQSD